MASETHETPQTASEETTNDQLLTWLSALGGGGIVLAMIAAGIGVVDPNVDSGLIGVLVLIGFAMLVMGIGGWVVVTQPHKNFDDINEPMYTGHHGEHDHEAPVEESVGEDDLDKVPSKEVLDSPGEVAVTEPPPPDQEVKPDDETHS